MAFLDTYTAGGGARGMALYRQMMQDAAAVNENLANAQYIEQQQAAPPPQAGVIPPGLVAPVAIPGVTTPSVDNTRVGVLPQTGATPSWLNYQGPVAGPAPTYKMTDQPGMRGRAAPPAVVPGSNENPWFVPPSMPLYGTNPAGVPTGVPVNQPPIMGPVNLANNALHDVGAAVNNVAARPLGQLAQWLFTSPGVAPPTAQLSTLGASLPPAANANVPPSAGVASPPAGAAPAASLPASAPAGVAGSPVPTATPAPTSGLSPDGSIPPTVRKEALRATPEQFDFYSNQLMQQRQQIASDANAQIEFLNAQRQQMATVAQGKIARLTQDAQMAQKTGNIGLMKKLQDQADSILADTTTALQSYDAQAFSTKQQADQAFRQNDQYLWQNQAMQAENEFVNLGDPSRMLHVLDAYGINLQLQDAGDGNYYAIDLNTQKPLQDGKGKARTFTRDSLSNFFHSTISDAFRQQQAATAAETGVEVLKSQLKIMEQSADNYEKGQIELIKNHSENYTVTKQDDGTTLITPNQMGSGLSTYIFNPNPQPNSDGVTPPRLQEVK